MATSQTPREVRRDSEESTLTNVYSTIPSRVNCNVPLKVDISEIPGAGRGVFTLRDVKAGEVLFTIANPLFSLAELGEIAPSVCDNCFAMTCLIGEQTSIRTVGDENLKLSASGGCKLVYYCSKKCQSEAWKHHHKFECKALGLAKQVYGEPLISTRWFRSTLRLAFLRMNNKLTSSELYELQSMWTGKELRMKDPKFKENSENICRALLDLKNGPKIGKEEVMELLCCTINTLHTIDLPLLRCDCAIIDPMVPGFVTAGVCLDPFVTMVNHSCQPNTFSLFEERKITIKACQDIEANTELFIDYTTDSDFESRCQELKTGWAIDCKCALCMKGNTRPSRELQAKILRVLDKRILDDASDREFESTIASLKAAGYGLDYPLMYHLHLWAVRCYLRTENFEEALKACLTVLTTLYLQHPSGTTFFGHRISLDELCFFLQMINPMDDPWIGKKISSVNIKAVLLYGYLQFWEIYVLELGKVYGRDSPIATHAKMVFEKKRVLMPVLWAAAGRPEVYVLMKDSEEQVEDFVLFFNALLIWAELPRLTKKEIFGK